MDDFGAGPFGKDGTQAPPPPHVFPDALAGLVTGERYEADAVPPIVVPAPLPPPQPGPAYVPPRRSARGQALRPVQHSRQTPRQASGQPAAHVPHAELARHQPKQTAIQQGPKKSKGGLIGCLVVLAALSGLLFNVVREIIEAVIDLVK
ncbi:hypothetical protein ALI22I_37340 [Saccharothrix sp. ALI-22-I]|uniref:hypothetical protein n=1 Tax=Saccharothrix sp. ALI-22-I TaxID=1933778 RepID=UPI00097BF5EC|nr:hypothetical protein [Saccharothrix sp. ALI-22-I]ONI81864.1 hypothetical protein ALI22I_37340 [Saccharothrix sp. ALI-22-I]